ncbi:MAG: DUF4368 domain-containing protein [Bacteroidales bacterium]|nr:DUF4368 domain-containing protein [Bacteroidales bacterium]MCM1417031.1 DUF4368 domain-containing protein [bacterium]MCM1423092.1 DUF4368 domain-containing protein [bacterium]
MKRAQLNNDKITALYCISDYAGITELNFKIINQLIDKILVSEPVEVDGQKTQ